MWCVKTDAGELVVRYYLVGPARGTDRVSLASIVLEVLRLFRFPIGRPRYLVPWREMDLTDPSRPRGAAPEVGAILALTLLPCRRPPALVSSGNTM